MKEKLIHLVEKRYNDVRVWEYFENSGSCYLRFTTGNDVYIANMVKAGSHVTIFKGEGNVLL